MTPALTGIAIATATNHTHAQDCRHRLSLPAAGLITTHQQSRKKEKKRQQDRGRGPDPSIFVSAFACAKAGSSPALPADVCTGTPPVTAGTLTDTLADHLVVVKGRFVASPAQ